MRKTLLLDLELIQDTFNLSDEELLKKVIEEGIELQKQAKEIRQRKLTDERKNDEEYRRIVLKFLKVKDYLLQWFTEDEIVNACANFCSISDLTEERAFRGHHEDCYFPADFLRHEKRKFTETKGSWQREVYDDASIFRIANPYQHLNASRAVKYLLLEKLPFLKEYEVRLYDINERNDWIFITINGTSLYAPFSCLLNRDEDGIINTHSNYWHNYSRGKKDEETKTFLDSKEVKEFFGLLVSSH